MTTTAPDQPRVVGRRRNPVKRVDFTLAVYDSRDVEHLHTLTARAQMDTSSVFGFGGEDVSPGRRVKALEQFLKRVLVDDDGHSVQEVPREVVMHAPDSRNEDSDNSDGETTGSSELVAVADLDGPRPTDSVWRLGVLDRDTATWTYAADDYPSRSLAQQAADMNPSSLRRFAMIMDDDWSTVEQSALEEIVDIVVSAAADRPTEPSNGSPRSARRRQR